MTQTSFPGEGLRERRESMGLSVEDVFRRIHVPVAYIEALETGALRQLPVPCYAVGFLKTYCQFLELDPNRFIESLQTCLRPPASRFLRRRRTAAPARRPPAWLHEAVTWAVVVAILLLGWMTYNVVFQPKTEGVEADTVEMIVPPSQEGSGF